jgi:hypothetical protein
VPRRRPGAGTRAPSSRGSLHQVEQHLHQRRASPRRPPPQAPRGGAAARPRWPWRPSACRTGSAGGRRPISGSITW